MSNKTNLNKQAIWSHDQGEVVLLFYNNFVILSSVYRFSCLSLQSA